MVSGNSFITSYIGNNHPAFLIIPFRAEDVLKNAELSRKYQFDLGKKIKDRFPGKFITLTVSGRKALELALGQQREGLEDKEVFIQTTSDNFYISGCVTKTIEKENKWHRDKNSFFNSVLVNHEFGYADERAIKVDNPHWIEDCAFSFDSSYKNGEKCGVYAPYAVFSFPKFFPIQIGGFLVSNNPIGYTENKEVVKYINSVVGFYFDQIDYWSFRRREIYKYYIKTFAQLGCQEYFELKANDVPGVFLFRVPHGINLQRLKEFYWERGIQCSVFYGDKVFFLPLNQFTEKEHVNYFADIYKAFLKENE